MSPSARWSAANASRARGRPGPSGLAAACRRSVAVSRGARGKTVDSWQRRAHRGRPHGEAHRAPCDTAAPATRGRAALMAPPGDRWPPVYDADELVREIKRLTEHADVAS